MILFTPGKEEPQNVHQAKKVYIMNKVCTNSTFFSNIYSNT